MNYSSITLQRKRHSWYTSGLLATFCRWFAHMWSGLGRGPIIPPGPAMVFMDRKDLNSKNNKQSWSILGISPPPPPARLKAVCNLVLLWNAVGAHLLQFWLTMTWMIDCLDANPLLIKDVALGQERLWWQLSEPQLLWFAGFSDAFSPSRLGSVGHYRN